MHITSEQIRQFIVRTLLFGQETSFGDDSLLLDAGVIDSTGMLELISHLEAQYSIRVGEEDMVPENFESINAIARFVNSKVNPNCVPVARAMRHIGTNAS